MQYKIKVQANIETVGWFETLLNNRLLLKGITFAKMYDTFWQKPFCSLEKVNSSARVGHADIFLDRYAYTPSII